MIDAAIKDHVWKAFESKETILKLYPVCDCGHVFKNFKMNTYSPTCEYFDETKVRLPSSSKFSPAICPKCGKKLKWFDTDSQGGRGYCCHDCRYFIWVSYNCVDKEYKELN